MSKNPIHKFIADHNLSFHSGRIIELLAEYEQTKDIDILLEAQIFLKEFVIHKEEEAKAINRKANFEKSMQSTPEFKDAL